MKKCRFFLIALTSLFIQCSDKDLSNLNGTWKLDSVYNFYNGFDNTSLDVRDFPQHHYEPNGQLRMTKDQEFRDFVYEIHPPDTLIFSTLEGRIIERQVILRIDDKNLVVKKELSPVFKEKNQERYEVKYFSRVKEQP